MMLEEEPMNTRVNTLPAGPFLTDIAKSWDEKARQSQPNALGRPGEPGEIVTSALYLPRLASSYAAGATLRVDNSTR
jgi:NAD(P)-dependent dehydrogenase (short-subunit alcohol dehydrogenase family)